MAPALGVLFAGSGGQATFICRRPISAAHLTLNSSDIVAGTITTWSSTPTLVAFQGYTTEEYSRVTIRISEAISSSLFHVGQSVDAYVLGSVNAAGLSGEGPLAATRATPGIFFLLHKEGHLLLETSGYFWPDGPVLKNDNDFRLGVAETDLRHSIAGALGCPTHDD